VDEPVQNGVGQCWIADGVVPVLDRELAGDDRGAEAPLLLAKGLHNSEVASYHPHKANTEIRHPQMPRSDAEWEKWFERREARKKKKHSSKSAEKKQSPNATHVGVPMARVIGEPAFFNESYKRSKILEFADYRRANPTPAEAELSRILSALNDGVLRRKFVREHVISGQWIVDFFFPEIRLAVEVDGSIHLTGHQLRRDKLKDADCAKFDITILRITNSEVFGCRENLISKLRSGWRDAWSRKNRVIGLSENEYFGRQ
jgi:very-short-patch-repair endonuclease